MRRGVIAVCVAGILLSGCTLAEFTSINRDFNITNNPSKLIDVKQRTILVSNHRDPDNKRQPIVCAEPSPDALTVLAAGFAAQGQAASGDGGSLAASIAESGGSIGLRTQSIQLLRDGFYRLCESYLSGAIDAEEYDILQRRYQANMIGLLAIEQLTGTVRPPSVVLGSSSSADAGTNLSGLRQLRENAADKISEIDRQIAELNKPTDPPLPADEKAAALKALNEKKQNLTKDVEAYDKAIGNAQAAVATAEGSGTLEAISVDSSRYQGENVKHIAAAVDSIAQSILRADYSGQLCFSWFRETEKDQRKASAVRQTAESPPPTSDRETKPIIRDLRDYCSAVLASAVADQDATTILKRERAQALAAAADAVRQLAASGKLETDELTELLDQISEAESENPGAGTVLLDINPEPETAQ